MKVLIGEKMYQMSKQRYKELLKVASEQVPCGIYAIEKKDYAELRCDNGTRTQTKKRKQLFRQQGFKVHTNGI